MKTVIDEGEYKLLPDFGDVWSLAYDNSEESLFEIQYEYHATLGLGGSLATITGARNGPATVELVSAYCQSGTGYIDAGDTERLKWTIIKSGCTEIAGEDQFTEFVETSKALNKYQEYVDKYGWDPDCYIVDPAQHKSARLIRKYFLPLKDRPEIHNTDKSP